MAQVFPLFQSGEGIERGGEYVAGFPAIPKVAREPIERGIEQGAGFLPLPVGEGRGEGISAHHYPLKNRQLHAAFNRNDLPVRIQHGHD